MNRYRLSKAGINACEGIERFNNDIEAYEKYLKEFLKDKQYYMLCDAIENKDVKAAFSAAHSLKGEAGNLSFTNLFNDINPLVEELRGGSLENAVSLLSAVSEDYSAIVAALSDS